jgi:hypothetical protein
MSSGAVSADDYPIRELREYIAGNLDVEHSHASPAALIDDKRVRDMLLFGQQEYEPVGDMPDNFWETKFARDMLERHVTDKVATILREGDKDAAAGITGLPNHEPDISGLHTINQLADWLIEPEEIKGLYIAGTQGAGKTSFSLTLLEVVARHFERARSVEGVDTSDVPEPEFAANFSVEPPGDTEVKLINTYSGLTDWLDGGDSDDYKAFVFDEASTELTAQSGENSEKVVDRLNSLWKRGRKKGLSLFQCIGHDKKDVHPLFRNLCDFVDKTDTKEASFYASVNDREGEGHLFDVSGIPEAQFSYDTDDMATWAWDGDHAGGGGGYSEEELRDLRNERIRRLYEQVEGITQDELADAFDVSRSTVTRTVNDD